MMTTSKRWGIAFVLSLMLNAFLLGSLVMHFARGHHGRPEGHHFLRREHGHGAAGAEGNRWARRGPVEAKLLRDVIHALGGPHDPRVRGELSFGRGKMPSHTQRMERAQRAIRAALAAEPFDENRLRDSLAELRKTTEGGQREAQDTLVRLAGKLSAEERRQLRAATGEPLDP